MNRFIDTTNEFGEPCKAIVVDGKEIIYPYESPCGRFFVLDPMAEYRMTAAEVVFLELQRIRMEANTHE